MKNRRSPFFVLSRFLTAFLSRFLAACFPASLFVSFCLFALLSGCATTNNANKTSSNGAASFFYIQNNAELSHSYHQNNWSVSARVIEQKSKPKTDFYDFIITSNAEPFHVIDINYKYGNYGKWRIIEKRNYLNSSMGNTLSATIKRFPITIKKSGGPHNQLLQITLETADRQIKYINLIFGIQKCIAKSEKEFICF